MQNPMDASHAATTSLGSLHLMLVQNPSSFSEVLLHTPPNQIDSPGPFGITPLILAILLRQNDAAMALLDCGASPEQADQNGRTPLMIASHVGLLPVVRRLIFEFNANVDYVPLNSRTNETALHHAIMGDQADVVEFFFELPPQMQPNVFENAYYPVSDELHLLWSGSVTLSWRMEMANVYVVPLTSHLYDPQPLGLPAELVPYKTLDRVIVHHPSYSLKGQYMGVNVLQMAANMYFASHARIFRALCLASGGRLLSTINMDATEYMQNAFLCEAMESADTDASHSPESPKLK